MRGFSSANWQAMVFFDTFFAILDFTKDPDFHLGVPQTTLRDWAIVLMGVLGGGVLFNRFPFHGDISTGKSS